MLKFIKSDVDNSYISFVSVNKRTGRVWGVRRNSPYDKMIAVLDKSLNDKVKLDTLYEVTMVRMSSKNGFIVTEINPKRFSATIETTYVPKAIYVVDIKFGNQIIRYNPFEGHIESMKDVDSLIEMLRGRTDIRNVDHVISDFREAANALNEKMRKDGFYFKTKKAKAS